jgi:hypothetical protein
MENLKELEPLYFNIRGKLAKLLGRESLSNPVVAICELIKNSYDADATKVTLEFKNTKSDDGLIKIIDNGSGLTIDGIEKEWMTIGTDKKEKEPYTRKFKRRKIGEKGVARFATEMVAHGIELISKPEGSENGYRVIINWDEYEKAPHIDRIQNKCFIFQKRKNDHGLELNLLPLRERWDENKIDLLYRKVELLIPPIQAKLKGDFDVKIEAAEFPKFRRALKPAFMKQAVFSLKSSLLKDGTAKFNFKTYKGKMITKEISIPSKCGPVEFRMFFFYRDRAKYPFDVDIKNIRSTLDRHIKGLHLYRDGLKVNLGEEDWAGLDEIRINDPSWYPSNKQIIGIISITRDENPEIIDITNREAIIENPSFTDLIKFVHKSIDFFVTCRKKVEKKKIKKLKRFPEKLAKEPPQENFIDFARSYPEIFYERLEDEINACHASNLPNAVLLLARKMVENLVSNLLDYKFPKQADLRWNINKNRPHDFSILLESLMQKKADFTQEEQQLIEKFLELCKRFKREANSKAHNIMEYIDNKEQLKNLKIPEIIQIALKLIIKTKK